MNVKFYFIKNTIENICFTTIINFCQAISNELSIINRKFKFLTKNLLWKGILIKQLIITRALNAIFIYTAKQTRQDIHINTVY